MSLEDLLGRFAKLKIKRIAAPGAYLGRDDGDDRAVVLLIGSETPADAKVGDEIDVFVHLDSEGRPIATTRLAKLELGQVTFLQVKESTPIGAFVDWGLAKDLLVPFKEQTADLNPGDRYAIGGKYRSQQFAQPGAGTRRVLGWFDENMVAGGDCSRQRHQRQVHRVVPG